MINKNIYSAVERAMNIKLDKDSKIKLIARRNYNNLFGIGDFIIKVSIKDIPGIPGNRLEREKKFFDKINQFAPFVPTPKILVVDSTKEIIPYNFSIMNKINGRPCPEVFVTLNKNQKQHIGEKAGEYLSIIHNIQSEGIGFFNNESQETTWQSHIFERIKKVFSSYNRLFSDSEIKKIEEFLDKSSLKFEGSSLLHNDFHYGNWLINVRNKSIESILDGEVSYSGVPEYDLGRFLLYTADIDLTKAFIKGYGKERINLSETIKYIALTGLELLSLFKNDEKRAPVFKKRIMAAILSSLNGRMTYE